MNPDDINSVNGGRPVVFRHATILTMDGAGVIEDGDLLITGSTITAVGPSLDAPHDAVEVDASGGILMPGMIDTHRHMWQTALRGLGADWTLTQYFVFYYLTWGKIFRPEDINAGNALSTAEALDAGVTTTLDWSHGLQTVEHAEAAVDALEASPGRFVLGYGNLLGAPWEWSKSPSSELRRASVRQPRSNDGATAGIRRHRRSGVPGTRRVRVGASSDLAVTTHAGVWGATNDDSIRLMWENDCMSPAGHVCARRDPQRGLVPAHRRHRRERVRVDRERAERGPGLSAHLGPSQARHPGLAVDGHQRVVERRPVLGDAGDAVGRPLAGTPRGACAGRDRRSQPGSRAEQVVEMATMGGARSLGLDGLIGSLTPGKQADVVLLKNDSSPAMYPLLHPYGSVVYQAGRGDVHTVVVNGRIVKHDHALVGIDLPAAKDAVGRTVEFARSTMGDEAWRESLTPELPPADRIPNPYTYTSYDGGESRHRAAAEEPGAE